MYDGPLLLPGSVNRARCSTTLMSSDPRSRVAARHWFSPRARRAATALPILTLGGLAVAAPLVAGHAAVWLLGGAVLLSGALELWQGFFMANDSARRSAFWGGGLSALIGGLLLASPMLVASALALFLGASFIADGMSRLYSAWTSRRQPEAIALDAQGVVNVLLGVLIAVQWPLSGLQVIGLSVGPGFSLRDGRCSSPPHRDYARPTRRSSIPTEGCARPCTRRWPVSWEAAVQAEEEARRTIDVYWQATFIATFFAIHAGRMALLSGRSSVSPRCSWLSPATSCTLSSSHWVSSRPCTWAGEG